MKLNEKNLEVQKKLQLTQAATSHGGLAPKAPNKSTVGGSASSRGGRKDRGTKRAREDVCSFLRLSLFSRFFHLLTFVVFFSSRKRRRPR